MSVWTFLKRLVRGIGRAIRAFCREIAAIFKRQSGTVPDTEEATDDAQAGVQQPDEEAAAGEAGGTAGEDAGESPAPAEDAAEGEAEAIEGEAEADGGESGSPEGEGEAESDQAEQASPEDDSAAVEEGGEASSEAGPEAEGSSYVLSINWLPEGIPCDSGETFGKGCPTSVTIHWIGAYPNQTPDIVRSWWETGGGEGSAHWIIKDNAVMQTWPTNKVCWHCGDMTGNRTSAGIEVIPMDTEGQFSVKSIATLKAVLDNYYPGLPLKRHYDWNGKDCPRYYVDEDKWAQLKTLLGRA